MTDLEVFLPQILPFAPGCPELVAIHHARQAAITFCERTRLWRSSDQISVTPTSCNVVCAPEGAELYEIENALIDGYPLMPVSIAELDRERPGWRDMEPTGGGKWITQTEPGSVMVVPPTTGTLKLQLFLKPSEEATQVPDFISAHHRRVIADGALAEILMLPAQPFSAPDRAQFYSMRFEQRLGELSARSIQGQQRAKLRTLPQWF